MRGIVMLFFMLAAGKAGFSQYTVTKVVGRVINTTSGEILKTGSMLRDTDVLGFSTNNDMLRVIVSGKGVYVISPGPQSAKKNDLIVDVIKSALKIKSKEGYLSGRSGPEELVPAVLQTDATVNTGNLLRRENKYLFDQQTYNVSGGNRFFLQTEVAGSKPVIRTLKTIADTLVLYAADFAGSAGAAYKLGFFTRDKNSSEMLTELRPVVDSTGELETIVRIMIRANKSTGVEELKRASYAEVYEAIGKPPAVLFDEVFERIIADSGRKVN